MGTKTKYTPGLLKKIEELASIGYTQRRIAEVLGITESALSHSKRNYNKVFQVFTRASEKYIQHHLKNIQNQSTDDWRASKYLLTVRRPDEFSERQKLELSGADGNPVEIQIVKNYGGKRKDEKSQ